MRKIQTVLIAMLVAGVAMSPTAAIAAQPVRVVSITPPPTPVERVLRLAASAEYAEYMACMAAAQEEPEPSDNEEAHEACIFEWLGVMAASTAEAVALTLMGVACWFPVTPQQVATCAAAIVAADLAAMALFVALGFYWQ